MKSLLDHRILLKEAEPEAKVETAFCFLYFPPKSDQQKKTLQLERLQLILLMKTVTESANDK